LFRIKILPILFVFIFLAPVAGKSFHYHHEHHIILPAPGELVIENICPVCQYEVCSFDVQIQQGSGPSVDLQDLYLNFSYQGPQSPGMILPFLLRAPPCD